MDTRLIFDEIRKMRPSSFSEEERNCYQAEKKMLRQFVLMKRKGQLPDYLFVKDMKTWLLSRRNFLEEFQEVIEQTGIDRVFRAKLAWTMARMLCLCQMEQEVLKELDKEEHLSQMFRRKVTLQGLQMFLPIVRPAAEEDVQTTLQLLLRKLLQNCGGIQVSSVPLFTAQLLELKQRTEALVPEVVDTVLQFLLEEPEREEKIVAEIANLLHPVASCLSQFGSVSPDHLLQVCYIGARRIIKVIYQRFYECSLTFHFMDYDESYYSAAEGVISAVQDMELLI